MRHEAIPVTSPVRTLVDLAAVVNEKMLRTAVRRALGLHRVSIRQLVAGRRRPESRRGAVKLDRVLATAAPTRTVLEDVVYALIVNGGSAAARREQASPHRRPACDPDFRWPAQRVVVEADGGACHDNPIAREDDAERQAVLEAHGDRVIRVSRRQAIARPGQTLARVWAAVAPVGAARP